ncbi:ABC transporter substrate-binding protein, partial [Bosea sp. (in: a-proteobacteria)]|uniref:ABC transporter substrate-binding protein n=1 Tax=Bosea sp. (in: a-proteobacteria) TaxID=1871050 RepID=UPI0012006824
ARRKLLVALGLCALVGPLHVLAQQPGKIPLIGVLRGGSSSDPFVEAFRRGLRDLGYVEGKNIQIEYRYAEGKSDRLPNLAAELVRIKSDVIVIADTPAIRAAKNATRETPIVMAVVADPVAAGLIASLARPGGNITGLSNLAPELDRKRLELLKETLPNVTRVAWVWDPGNPALTIRLKEMQAAAQVLGLKLQALEVRNPKELESAFEAAIRERAGALSVPAVMVGSYRRQIVDFAAMKRLPLFYDTKEFAERAGGVMSYGPDFADLFRRAATYVDKILKGAKPADLPVEQPTKFELVVNMKTAKALGIKIPNSILVRADKVIK